MTSAISARMGLADLAGLGERADGGRGQRRQAEPAPLGLLADVVGAGPVQVGLADRVQPPAHRRVAGPARLAPGGQRAAVRGQLLGDRVGALGQPPSQGDDLGHLLAGEGQPRPDLRVEGLLGVKVDRDVLERARGRHDHVAGQAEQGGQGGQRPLEVVGPDVAAVDHPGDQGPAAEAAGGGQQLEVAGAVPGQVEADAVDRGAGEDPEGVAQVVEVAGDQQLGTGAGPAELVVGAGQGVQLGRRAVLDEGGLVQLHPLGPGGLQLLQQLAVYLQQRVEQAEPVEAGPGAVGGLAEQQEGDRAEQDRAGGDAELAGLGQLGQGLGRGRQPEHDLGTQLGDQVVVVGVEPLGHLHGGGVGSSPGHGEVGVQIDVAGGGPPVAAGDGADQHAGVEHLVVEREVVGGDLPDPGVAQEAPGLAAQLAGRRVQLLGRHPARPVAFGGGL
jgi:hypothetical protein